MKRDWLYAIKYFCPSKYQRLPQKGFVAMVTWFPWQPGERPIFSILPLKNQHIGQTGVDNSTQTMSFFVAIVIPIYLFP
jgi:hypothetical protein